MREPDADHHDTLARVHCRAGQLVEAEEKARRAIELLPVNVKYHDTLALVLGDAGRLDDAEAEARRAIELAPGDTVAGRPAGCCAPYFAESFPVPVAFPHGSGGNLPAKEIFPRSFRVTGTQDDRGPVLWPTCALAAPRRLRSRGATGVNVYLALSQAYWRRAIRNLETLNLSVKFYG